MGGGLSSLSKNNLPCPGSIEDKEFLEKLGIVFDCSSNEPDEGSSEEKTSNNNQLRLNTMIRTTLPPGFGFWMESNRGDIINAILIDDQGYQVATIFWMSKGSYDNVCSITPQKRKDRKLDLTKVKLNESTGYFQQIQFSDQKQYHDLVNQYYERQFRGAPQCELDKTYFQIKNFEIEHLQLQKLDYSRLRAQTGDGEQFKGAMTAMATNFTKPFPYTDPAPWLDCSSDD